MKTSRRVLLLLGMVGLVMGGYVFLSKHRDTLDLILSDGSTVLFLGAVPGGTPYSSEESWHKFLRQHVARKYVRWLPPVRSLNCGSLGSLSLCFMRLNIPTNQQRGAFWGRVEAIEAGGYTYSNSPGSCSSSLGNQEKLLSFSLRNYPRRQSQFPVVIYGDEQEELVRLMVKNPGTTTFPEWAAEGLPITNVVNGTRLVLHGFKRFQNNYGGFWRPQVQIESLAGKESPLKLRYFSFEDPTGNKGASLSPSEPVWKSVIKLYRPKDSEFPESMKGQFVLAEIPSQGQVFPRQEVMKVGGLGMRLLFFSGPGVTTISNNMSFHAEFPDRELGSGSWTSSSGTGRSESWESNHHYLVIETEDPGLDVELLFQVHDQDGLPVERANQFHGYRGGGGLRPPYKRRYTFPLILNESVSALNVECTINRGESFEFLVNSSDLFALSVENP